MAVAAKPSKPPMPPIARNLDRNVDYLNDLLGIGQGAGHSWDIMAKPFEYDGFKMMSYVLNGYFLTMNMVLILEDLQRQIQAFVATHPEGTFTLDELLNYLNTKVAFVQVQPVQKMEDCVRFILSGPLITFIEGLDQALLIDTRIYPMRGIQASEVERVVRGPRDSFTETMLMNTALIRRRLRDPSIRAELMQIGNRGKTDVTMMYMNEITNPKLVDRIRSALKEIDPDSIIMGEQSVTELICKTKWNPYPMVRYTERPDVAASALLEGHVIIVVDTTPEVIIAPITLFQLLQHPEEFHSYPMVGTFMRWMIFIAALASVVLPGIFLIMNFHPETMPRELAFFKATQNDPLPLWAELLVAEFLLTVLRLAVMNIPTPLASMVSIVAAVVFGQSASQIKLVQPEVLVYMAIVMACQFALPTYELAAANQLTRLWVLAVTQVGEVFGWDGWALLIAIASWGLFIATRKSFGVPYLWPLLPFKWSHGMEAILFRKSSTVGKGMPSIFGRKSKV